MAGIGQSTPGITSPANQVATINDVDAVVVAENTSLKFVGDVVLSVGVDPNQTVITVGGAGVFADRNLSNLLNPVQPNESLDFQTGPQKIINLPAPVDPGDAANKAYVDALSPASAWLKAGNTLAAGDKFGSLNAIDVEIIRNNIQRALFTTSGLSLNTASGTGGYVFDYGFNSFAFGTSSGAGTITATQIGSFAFGRVNTNNILASGTGALAFGDAINAFNITASAQGAFAGGIAESGNILASAPGSFAHGDDNESTGEFSVTFGHGNDNDIFACLVVGRFANGAGTPGGWVSADPVFIAGNGTSSIAKNNAFQVDKDGRLVTTGAQVHKAIRMVAALAAISDRTDRTIICDTTGAGGALTLPVGVDGMEYLFSPSGVGGATYTITPSGGNTLDPNVASVIGVGVKEHIQFLNGVWYSV